MQVGVPVAPISTAYSLVSQDFAKLRTIHGLLAPGLVYASDGARYARAFEARVGSMPKDSRYRSHWPCPKDFLAICRACPKRQ